MTQVFIFGASIAYGAGATVAGWADLLKQSFQTRTYSNNDGSDNKHELYNFALYGARAEFVAATYSDQLKFYRRGDKIIAIVCVGGNNVKAIGKPNSYVTSIEEYENFMGHLLGKMRQEVDELLVLPGLVGVDESKNNPEVDSLTGEKHYFTNDRIIIFNHTLMKTCTKYGARYIDIDISPDEWAQKYLYDDGLHPNQVGHQYIFEKVSAVVEKLL